MSTFRELVLVAIMVIQVSTSVNISEVPSACHPYEEGSDVSLPCTDRDRLRKLVWHHNEAEVAECFNNSSHCISNYEVVRENGTSILSIFDIDRRLPSSEGSWRCSYDSPPLKEELYHCDLIIYHAPENLHCTTPLLTQEEKQHVVVVNCSAFNVFPSANCTFFRRISSNNDVELQSSSYRRENAKVDPIYFNIFCGLTYQIKDDLVGNLTFFLKMSMDFNKSYDSNQASIHIDAPKPKLLENCFSGREDNVFWPNETIHCTCEIRDIDNSTMDVVWFDADHPTIIHRPSTVYIHYEEDKDTTFICEGTSRSGREYNITYKPTFAAAAQVTQFTANGEIDLNVENGTVVEFNCEVDSKPRGTVYITDSSGQRLDGTSKLLTCDDTGTYTCQAFNEIFPNDISRQYVHVTVKCNPWLELITTGSKIQRVYANTAENVSIDFELSMGNTKIIKYKMYKDGKDTPTVMYADKDENAANGRCRIQFRSLSETHYKITLNIFNIKSSDFGTYTLKIHDDNGDVVEGKLEINGKISDDNTTKPVFYVPLMIVIVLVVVFVVYRLFNLYRKHKNITGGTGPSSGGLSTQNTNTTNNTTNTAGASNLNTSDGRTRSSSAGSSAQNNNTTNTTGAITLNSNAGQTGSSSSSLSTQNINTTNNTTSTAGTNTLNTNAGQTGSRSSSAGSSAQNNNTTNNTTNTEGANTIKRGNSKTGSRRSGNRGSHRPPEATPTSSAVLNAQNNNTTNNTTNTEGASTFNRVYESSSEVQETKFTDQTQLKGFYSALPDTGQLTQGHESQEIGDSTES